MKQYLVTGKINPDEITSLGLTSHKINQDSTTGATNDNNQIDFSQDWEKMSLNSHNSNLILFNNKKNVPTLTLSASKPVLNPQLPANNKMKLQETKTKIDKYFNKNNTMSRSPDNFKKMSGFTFEKEGNAIISHLRINHLEVGTSSDIKGEKSEKNVSTRNILTPKVNPPKIITHIAATRPPSQSKIHLKKNNISEISKK